MSIKRTTHTWLKPVWDNIDGITQRPYGVATSVHGFYGTTGIARIATGGLSVVAASGLGASGFQATGIGSSGFYTHLAQAAFNGGSGAAYTLNDVVCALKNMGILPRS